MRLTRRTLLGGGGAAALAGLAGLRFATARPGIDGLDPVPVDIRALPIERFGIARDGRRVGQLTFRSGVELQAAHEAFGGFSGLWRAPDGRSIVALSDAAQWLTADVETADGRLAGLARASMAPVLGASGRPLRRSRSYDTEALAIHGGVAYAAIERTQEVVRFDFARQGVRARAQVVPVPVEAKRLPSNKGLEAIGVVPAGGPLAGALVVVAEQVEAAEDAPTLGFILTGPQRGAFTVARSGGFDVTDLAFLSSGEMLLLERRFSLLRGPAARLRRIPADRLRPGVHLDGPVIFEADAGYQIDNMEGLAVHQEGGETILTMISDDNFSRLQRTLLLDFVLDD